VADWIGISGASEKEKEAQGFGPNAYICERTAFSLGADFWALLLVLQ
jgi:hypothetical protein